jgi:hypothetical protein
MRPAIAILVMLTTGGLSSALADPPATPAPESRGTTAQNSTSEDSASQNSVSQTAPATAAATAAGTSATASTNPAPHAPEEPAEEKLLRLQGYRPTMVSGEMLYCRREIPLGSHLPSTLKCVTVAEAKLMAEEGRRTTERIQRNTVACLNPQTGGCGN